MSDDATGTASGSGGDGDDQRAENAGESTDGDASDAGSDTVPKVELGLYQLSVSVSGQADDELEDVENTAQRLMEYLVGRAQELEDAPDGRGLG